MMFTGIVSDLAKIILVSETPERGTRFEIASHFDLSTIKLGASIAHNGVCLTVVDIKDDVYAVEVSGETVSKTTLGQWRVGDQINLERPLTLGDELGGHLVSGHVDGVGEVVAMADDGASRRIQIAVPQNLARFIAPKGSVTVDGVSLTINEVVDDPATGCRFGINVIPHTQQVTSLGFLRQGQKVNLEIDLVARYVARLTEKE
jgi:riboflavin synthase